MNPIRPPARLAKPVRVNAMCPSPSSLIRLYESAGQHWDVISDAVDHAIRQPDVIPKDAATVTIQLDGMMVPVAPKSQEQQGSGAVKWTEAVCGAVIRSAANGDRIRPIRHGRMPEAGKATLQKLIVAEGAHLCDRAPHRRRITVAHGTKDNGRFLTTSFPQATQF